MASVATMVYLAIGALLAVFFLAFSGQRGYRSVESPADRLLGLVTFRLSNTNGVLKRVRWLLRLVVAFPPAVMIWPALLFMFLRSAFDSGGYRRRLANAYAFPPTLLVPIGLLLATLTIVVSNLVGGGGNWVTILCISILVALMADLFSYLALQVDLPALVRQNALHPYMHFTLLAVADYLILLLNSALLETNTALEVLTIPALFDQAAELSTLSRFVYTITHFPRSPIDALVAASGLLYFATIVKLIFQFRQFKRQSDDYAKLVNQAAWFGDFATAQRWLGKIEDVHLGDSRLISPRILTHLGLNEYDASYTLMKLQFAINSSGKNILYSTDTADDHLQLLLSTAAGALELKAQQYGQLVTYACGKGITDGCLLATLQVFAFSGRYELEGVEDAERLGVTSDRYPLTHSWVAWSSTDDYIVELAELERITQYSFTATADRLYRELALYQIKEYHSFSNIQHVRELVAILRDASELPAWCRVNLVQVLGGIIDAEDSDELRSDLNATLEHLLLGASKEELQRLQALRSAKRTTGKSK